MRRSLSLFGVNDPLRLEPCCIFSEILTRSRQNRIWKHSADSKQIQWGVEVKVPVNHRSIFTSLTSSFFPNLCLNLMYELAQVSSPTSFFVIVHFPSSIILRSSACIVYRIRKLLLINGYWVLPIRHLFNCSHIVNRSRRASTVLSFIFFVIRASFIEKPASTEPSLCDKIH